MIGSGPVALVGREQELAVLRAGLAAASEGRPSAVVVAGDAGVGKSRLVEVMRTEAGLLDPGQQAERRLELARLATERLRKPAICIELWQEVLTVDEANGEAISALSALWMTLFYAMPAINGPGLYVMRLVFGTAMAAAIVFAFVAIRRGDITTHSAWMTRAYAIGLGAGTQVFTFLPWTLFFGQPGQVMHTVLMGAGWVINLAVAEYIIRHRAGRRTVSRGAVDGRTIRMTAKVGSS